MTPESIAPIPKLNEIFFLYFSEDAYIVCKCIVHTVNFFESFFQLFFLAGSALGRPSVVPAADSAAIAANAFNGRAESEAEGKAASGPEEGIHRMWCELAST